MVKVAIYQASTPNILTVGAIRGDLPCIGDPVRVFNAYTGEELDGYSVLFVDRISGDYTVSRKRQPVLF